MVDVVSEARSGVRPGRSGAPQLEQNRLAASLRWPHLLQTCSADMDGSSRRGCPAEALVAYGSEANPPPELEVDGSPKPMRPVPAGSTADAPCAPETSPRPHDLVAEERPVALPFHVSMTGAVPGSTAFLAVLLAEQLLKQLHGRFPLTETDPPVGQDELRMQHLPTRTYSQRP